MAAPSTTLPSSLTSSEALRAGPDVVAVDAARLADLVRGVVATADLWWPLVQVDPQQRWYAKIVDGVDAEVWLISWDRGQSLDLHDHGDSRGCFQVVSGVLTERWPTLLGGTGRCGGAGLTLGAGEVRSFEPGYVHSLGNDGDAPAVSVHAYSPPLTEMRTYSDPFAADSFGTGRFTGVGQ